MTQVVSLPTATINPAASDFAPARDCSFVLASWNGGPLWSETSHVGNISTSVGDTDPGTAIEPPSNMLG